MVRKGAVDALQVNQGSVSRSEPAAARLLLVGGRTRLTVEGWAIVMVVGRFETHPIHMKDPGQLSLRFNARMPEHAMTVAAIMENDTDIPPL
jgi:hypothetical protein